MMQGAAKDAGEAPGLEAEREREAAEAACRANPAACSPPASPPGASGPPSVDIAALHGCEEGHACTAGAHIFGPNSCHFPWIKCHIDFTKDISWKIVLAVYPHEGSESTALALACAIPAVASAEAGGALGFACLAVLAIYWGSLIDTVNSIHEHGGCISIQYAVTPAIITGLAVDRGKHGCVQS
jgi:hypothetical protein